MKRRAFVQTTALGALGFCYTPGIGQTIRPAEQWHTWLNKFIYNCGINEIAGWMQVDAQLSQSLSILLRQGIWKGFSQQHTSFYFYNNTYAFVVLEKWHSAIDLKEVALPMWAKQADGKWKHLTSLSVFQLEAIAYACDALASEYKDETIADYLLPIATNKQNYLLFPGDYSTLKGLVRVVPKVAPSGVSIYMQIAQDSQAIWEDRFISHYCLTCQA